MNTSRHSLNSAILDRLQDMVMEKLPHAQRAAAALFVRQYYLRVPAAMLEQRDPIDLYGAALAHWHFAYHRVADEILVRVYNPVLEEHGWECPHTVVEVVVGDMPFLLDTVRMEINRQGFSVLDVIHPIYHITRNAQGEVSALSTEHVATAGEREAVIHMELMRQTDRSALQALQNGLEKVLRDVHLAVTDWRPMREAAIDIDEALAANPPPIDAEELAEVRQFLKWIVDNHFTFLGYRAYELVGEGSDEALRIVPGSGLGILRETAEAEASQAFAGLPPALRKKAREPRLLVLTKANARATVHRPANLDYIGIKRIDSQGRVNGEYRFLGLYGSRAYSGTPQEIPVLRKKLEKVMRRSSLEPDSHSFKAMLHILEHYPRDELFQIDEQDLARIADGILLLGEHQRPRLFLRKDPYGRFVMCMMYVPRESYDTHVRRRMQAILRDAFNAGEVEFAVSLTDAPMARILFTARSEPGRIPVYDAQEIESRLVDAILSWSDRLQAALLEQYGEERGADLFHAYGEGFPAGYREDFPARTAVRDIMHMETLGEQRELAMSLYRPLEAAPGTLRFKVMRYQRGLPLSSALPMLEHMGVRVEDERPYLIERSDGGSFWVHDFGLSYAGGDGLDTADIRSLFQDAFEQVWRGNLANDGFNGLVLAAQLNWRQISLLRAYAKYLRQTAMTFSQMYMEEAMNANPRTAALMVELFEARFDPAHRKQAGQRATRLLARLQEELDAVDSLDHDRILRAFLAVIQATLRTNYYQSAADGTVRETIALKLDSAHIPDLPAPRPMFEVFVYSPRVEGVHLRGGKVARGGLRWSDRREDFRTEILGLMKAQMVKNAVIVPVGAKGGFVIKQPPPAAAGRAALRDEGVICYRQFISGLLDVTDNLSEDQCQSPPRLVRYDGDDPYLVVAADKGTATFSDIANEVAASYRFWLGDAFASGGQAGYDHKRMGITANGAWEAVKQHFFAAGIDYQKQPFSVIGIGDMSGDVFGNGMLWSSNIKLVAAFDHRHIFIDPDPDAERSFQERQRLFALAGSSWADYDSTLLSTGGGVYARTLKSVRLSPRARAVLDIASEALTPDELIRRLLKAPVDLLWNGGIGTYVKASSERHADVGDRVNDALRVNGRELRCRVVGEGGNLGLTQLARIEYARQGGRLDTDFIHNAGGVNCSDHEVNIKILLDRVVTDGDMTLKQRNALLAEMTGEVGDLVLRDSYWQTCAISLDEMRAVELLPEHIRFMRHLEQGGELDRALEFLPDDEELAKRHAAGQGLTRPEIALLVSYAKHTLSLQLLNSDFPEDPCMARELERYFPAPLRQRFAKRIHSHRLRREILAGTVANRLVNRFGSTFVFRLQEELGASAATVARAYAVVWEVFGLRHLWSGVVSQQASMDERLRIGLLLRGVGLAGRACRWLLQNHDAGISVAALMERYRDKIGILSEQLPQLLDPQGLAELQTAAEQLQQDGVPLPLGLRVVGLNVLCSGLDMVEVADQTGMGVEEVARVYFPLGAELQLGWLAQRLTELPSHDRWHASARAALRDELAARQRHLCRTVLRGGMDGASAASRLETWLHQNHALLQRYRGLIHELMAQEKVDLAMLSVALRELRKLSPSSSSEVRSARK